MVPITIEDEVSFTNKYSLIATINHSGTSNMGHYWALSRIYSPLLGTFGMASQILTLKKIMLTILHHTSFFTAKFKFFLGSTKYFLWFCEGFCYFRHFRHFFGCDNPTYNPRPQSNMEIRFAPTIFRHYNPGVLSFRDAIQWGLTRHGLVCEE